MIAVPTPAAVTGTATDGVAAGREPHLVMQSPDRHIDRSMNVEIDRVIARRSFDIVDLQEHAGLVAEREETRQRRRDDDRIAHDDVGLRGADPRLRPGDRHDAHRAVEGRNVEGHLRRAVRGRP